MYTGPNKVTIVGCGSVGATTAYALLLDSVVTELTLIDIDKKRAQGLMLDLEHSLSYTSFVKLEATDDMAAAHGSHIVIITAGKRQNPDETRLDCARENKKIFDMLIPKLADCAPDALFLIASNPLDVMTYHALKTSGLPWQRVFGTGTVLDSARLQFHISEQIKIHPRSIDAYVLGEHGDSAFPVWSSANVMGLPLFEVAGFSKEKAATCYELTKKAAYHIINDMGFTCYSIATVIREITRSICADTHQVFTLSALLNDFYGHNDACVSVPCVLGKNGIVQTLQIPLNADEQKKLSKSVDVIRALC